MDAYLESLVVKGNKDPQPEAEVNVPVESINNEVAESADTEINLPETEIKQPEPIEEPVTTKDIAIEESVADEPSTDYEMDAVYPVTNVKVYKSPDERQLAKIVTGNVVYKGKVDRFYIIDYMRHGFGMVRGYALSLK